jgi:hypothetical protein
MRRLLARLAILGAFAATAAACSNGSGTSLPFAGPPNNGGGGPGQFQPGANGTALLRFVQGSPDYAKVDVCIDNLPFGVTAPVVAYGTASATLYAVPGGISYTVATYPSLGGAMVGLECPTAPGPYLGTPPILVTTIAPGTAGNPARETIVLGGTAASHTLGLYVFGEPSFATAPAGDEAISHNAAPAFSGAAPNHGVGFGYIIPPPTNLAGAANVAAPTASTPIAAVINANVQSSIAAVPVSFYDGTGVLAGNVVPITTIPAPGPVAGQPYVIQLYAIDATAGGLNLVAVPEQTLGFGF